jgi:hypothetical protein
LTFSLPGPTKYTDQAYFLAHVVGRGAVEVVLGPLEEVSLLENRADLGVADRELIFGLCKR